MMNRNLLLLTFILFLGSCGKEFIQVFETGALNSKLSDGNFVFENDTVRITYDFWHSKGIMSFTVFNKLDKPIYVNWKSSSFIHNDNKLNYWADIEYTELAAYYGGYFYKGPPLQFGVSVNEGVAVSSSKKSKPERVTFIPPKSNYHRHQFILLPIEAFDMGSSPITTIETRLDNPKKQTSVYSAEYSTQQAPLRFRNYLAMTFSESSEDYFFVDNAFYLKTVKELELRHFRGKKTGTDEEGNAIYPKPLKKPTSFYIKIDGDKCVEYKNSRL